jgi:hypothetical protein
VAFKAESEAFEKVKADFNLAEKNLIDFALAIVPKKIADVLRGQKSVVTKNKIITAIMKLDTRTIPSAFIGAH